MQVLKTCLSSLDDITFLQNGSENRSKPIEKKTKTKPVLFFICFVKPSFRSIFGTTSYTNFLVKADSFYANFTCTTFQKIPIPHLTCSMKHKFLH